MIEDMRENQGVSGDETGLPLDERVRRCFNELCSEGHPPIDVARALTTVGLAGIAEVEGMAKLAESLGIMSRMIADDCRPPAPDAVIN